MSASTLVLYTKTTGHVLAAATVAAPPSGEIKPESLAGDSLQVRYLGHPDSNFAQAQITVPADELLVLSVDAKAVPIEQVRTYRIKVKEKSPVTLDDSKTVTVTSTTAGFSVSFLSLSAEPTVVWARLEAVNATNQSPATQTTITDANPAGVNQNVTVQVSKQNLPSGDYWALVLVPGFVPFLSKITL